MSRNMQQSLSTFPCNQSMRFLATNFCPLQELSSAPARRGRVPVPSPHRQVSGQLCGLRKKSMARVFIRSTESTSGCEQWSRQLASPVAGAFCSLPLLTSASGSSLRDKRFMCMVSQNSLAEAHAGLHGIFQVQLSSKAHSHRKSGMLVPLVSDQDHVATPSKC